MTVAIADTGPIHYLILSDAIDLLARLFDRVIIPRAVLGELTHPHAPSPVGAWARSLPEWVEVRSPSSVVPRGPLDAGETEVIALAMELSSSVVLLDETEARSEALRLGLYVTGTVGVLERAAEQHLIDLRDALGRLLKTNFRIATDLVRDALARDARRKRIL